MSIAPAVEPRAVPHDGGLPAPVPPLRTWRCERCGRILAKLALAPGSVVEVKCGCNLFNTLDLRAAPSREAVATTAIL